MYLSILSSAVIIESLAFFAVDDYQRYLADLKEAADKNQCHIHAYVLMTNHVHLLVTPMIDHGVTLMMQDLGRKYVRYINHTYRRSGTLWEGRFKSSLIDSHAYLLTCMRYIELNPVRASMVDIPGEYQWSSYRYNAYGEDDKVITTHPLYESLSTNRDQRLHCYRELFSGYLANEQLHEIREALNQELVLGRNDFKDKIEQMTQRQVRAGRSGRPRVAEEECGYIVW